MKYNNDPLSTIPLDICCTSHLSDKAIAPTVREPQLAILQERPTAVQAQAHLSNVDVPLVSPTSIVGEDHVAHGGLTAVIFLSLEAVRVLSTVCFEILALSALFLS